MGEHKEDSRCSMSLVTEIIGDFQNTPSTKQQFTKIVFPLKISVFPQQNFNNMEIIESCLAESMNTDVCLYVICKSFYTQISTFPSSGCTTWICSAFVGTAYKLQIIILQNTQFVFGNIHMLYPKQKSYRCVVHCIGMLQFIIFIILSSSVECF